MPANPAVGVSTETTPLSDSLRAWSRIDTTSTAELSYFSAIDSDFSWIRRRVETVKIVDAYQHERYISIDVDLIALRRIAELAGLEAQALPVSLGIESKGLHLDLDLRDASGASLSLAPSSVDAFASFAIAADWLDRNCGHLSFSILSEIKDNLLRVARHHFTKLDDEGLKQFLSSDEGEGLPMWTSGSSLGPEASAAFSFLIENEYEFLDLLIDLSARCRPLVVIPASGDTFLIKIRRLEAGRLPERSLSARMRLAPSTLQIEDSTLGRGLSCHLRVVAPNGTDLDTVVIQGPRWLEPYRVRVTSERAMIHATASEFSVDQRFVSVGLWPAARGFVMSSLATCLGGTALFLALLHLERTRGGYVTTFASHHPDVVFAAVLALPSVYIVFLSRLNEHDFRSYLLGDLRLVLGCVGICHTAGLLALMVAGRFESLLLPTWLIAVTVSSIAALMLVAGFRRSRTRHYRHDHVTFVENAFTIQMELELDEEIDLY